MPLEGLFRPPVQPVVLLLCVFAAAIHFRHFLKCGISIGLLVQGAIKYRQFAKKIRFLRKLERYGKRASGPHRLRRSIDVSIVD